MTRHPSRHMVWAAALMMPILVTPTLSAHANAKEGGFFGGLLSLKRPQASVGQDISNGQGTIQIAQAENPRVNELENEIRQLNGKIEELNFMVLQMQEQIRTLQNGGQAAAPIAGQTGMAGTATPPSSNERTTREANPRTTVEQPRSNAGLPGVFGRSGNNTAENTAGIDDNTNTGTPPHDLGSIRFDKDGNVIGQANNGNDQNANNAQAIAVPQTDDPKALYNIGYQYILAGDYPQAEAVFRSFQERFPSDPLIADASFWLGEALFGQEKWSEAAVVYTDVQKNYQDSPRGPENLFKLGVSMAHLDDKKVACAVFNEVGKRYARADPALLKRVKDEQSRNKCQ